MTAVSRTLIFNINQNDRAELSEMMRKHVSAGSFCVL